MTFEKFQAQQMLEMSSEDPAHQNLSATIKMADHVLINDGTVEQLYERIEEILKNIGV